MKQFITPSQVRRITGLVKLALVICRVLEILKHLISDYVSTICPTQATELTQLLETRAA